MEMRMDVPTFDSAGEPAFFVSENGGGYLNRI